MIMAQEIIVIVYWCLATLSMGTFNPHVVGAVKDFVHYHPESCKAEPSDFLMLDDVGIDMCQRRAMLSYMPGWLQKSGNQDKVYLGSDCEVYNPIPVGLDLEPLKRIVTP
jgi:hypothetical protein